MTTPRLSSEETGRELGGRYRLVAPIGVGTSSRVHLAIDTQLRRRVAVKLLHEALADDDAFLRRFRAEARAAGALSHPNIVAVFDWGEDRTDRGVVPYLVTEYLGGGSLQGMLDHGAHLTPSQTLLIGLDVARALDHAHRRGLVHRDVKPGNLLFDEEGRLRLADFGLARALAEASWTEPSGATVGTARYASPEQALGRRLDGRSDVYSLGLVLVECVTGAVPFTGETTASTLALRTQGNLVLGPELGSLRGPLERACRLDPDERPDAGELEIALMAAAETMARPEPLPLVPTLGEGESTSELRVAAALPSVIPLTSGRPDRAAGEEAVDLTGDAGGATSTADATGATDADDLTGEQVEVDLTDEATGPLVRTPIVVAEEHELLASSRPASLGPVDPFGAGAPPAPVPEGRRPRRRLRVVLLVLAVLAVLGGGFAAWWFLIRVPVHEVPRLVGQDVAAARARARDLGWTVDASTRVRRDGTEPGEVVAQDPGAGRSLAEGEEVSLTVSLGPTLVALPDVAGATQEEATAKLTDAGLEVGAVTTAHDEEVPEGRVVSAVPARGEEPLDAQRRVPKETVVDLVLSDGPAPRKVPDGLAGLPQAEATARLEQVQLTADVQGDWSDTVPEGVVIAAEPAAGAELPRDSAVKLVVSKGPAPVPVPDVRGLTGTAASARLEQSGFTVSGIEGSPSGQVLATDPPAGEPHQRGTAVRIFTRS